MDIKEVLLMIMITFNAIAVIIISTALIKLTIFKIFKFLPTKQLFKEYVFMHLIIVILIITLVILLNNYSMPGVFRVAAPIYIVFSIFEAFYIYENHLKYEPINQYTFSMIISSLINMFLMTFLMFKAFYIIL